MTLKSWLSSNNVHSPIITSYAVHESPTGGCSLPFYCGARKERTRSVEHGLDSSMDQSDYGFLDYRSTKDFNKSTSTLSRSMSQRENNPRRSTPLKDEGKKSRRSSLSKRNSVLSRLKPEKWRFDGHLKRSRSRDDVLEASNIGQFGLSEPDLLNDNYLTYEVNLPSPISILPPSCKSDPANYTLPRKFSDLTRTQTFFSKSRKWFAGMTNKESDNKLLSNKENGIKLTNKENDRNRSNISMVSTVKQDGLSAKRQLNFSDARYDSGKIHRTGSSSHIDETYRRAYALRNPIGVKHPLEEMRSRRPLTYHILDDYLSPTSGKRRMTIDSSRCSFLPKGVTRSPRMLASHMRNMSLDPFEPLKRPRVSKVPSTQSLYQYFEPRSYPGIPYRQESRNSMDISVKVLKKFLEKLLLLWFS